MAAISGDGEDPRELEELLAMLKENRGFDFSGYKRSTLTRRIGRRMIAVGLATFGEYRDFLEVQPEEYAALFDNLLINVTGFFRDAPAWKALAERVVPELAGTAPATETGGTASGGTEAAGTASGGAASGGQARPIRVWSAGCSTGEEAYTLAMVLAEALGADAFRERVKIYATDLDESALQTARTGAYPERRMRDVPAELRAKYFERVQSNYVFRRDLRRQVIFGRNDLTRDAPISRVDLLVVRNTLMYFNAETQAGILRRMHFALNDSGYIFLGKAEMLLSHGDWFEPVDLRKRLFHKLPGRPRAPRIAVGDAVGEHAVRTARIRAAVLAAGPVAQLALDTAGDLVVANTQAEALFHLHPKDVGRPFQDLEVSFRPVELRSIIERVKQELRPVELKHVEWQRSPSADRCVLDVVVGPLFDNGQGLLGVGISFTDVSRYSRLHEELEHANEELERAYQELQSLNEELETTNEELQSTNEELETTNEELQSTNEELETTNEELQSTNDELQEINDALRMRTGEVDAANAFLGSVLRSLGMAVIVVDGDLRVTVWTQGAEELWGVRADEARGQHLLGLDIGLPVQEVAPLVRRSLESGRTGRGGMTLDAINRRGRPVRLRIETLPLSDDGAGHGVILIVDHAGSAGGGTVAGMPAGRP
ncbi:CheR family methyltransferase [Actinomadura sp. 9N407]|uniref:CheR family methyltransferase n=1 Tax=Actinomadura sp. 9N407 TaxID=3375154 RepID=UPI00378C2717